MEASARRKAISAALAAADAPVSASALAARFSVSRQVIVGDIALLRAAGADISATPRGYVLSRKEPGVIRTVACRHALDGTEQELLIMVDNGCTVLDVVVEHAVYGQLTGQLQLSSRYDVAQFMERLEPDAVQISGDGSFDFWFNDGALFWGHSIHVTGSLEGGPEKAEMEG